MNNLTRFLSSLLVFAFLFASCSSTTMILSNPSKAKLYINGAYVGQTPYEHIDTKIVGSSMVLKLEKEGFKPLVTTITRDEEVDVGAIIGGVFFGFPFLWTMKYQPTHNYDLMSFDEEQVVDQQKSENIKKSKVSSLRDLKQLLDEGIITQDEFQMEKTKILNAEE